MATINEVILKASLEGKINNLPHFKNEALLPVFEAVANAIQSIEEHPGTSKGYINVTLHRDYDLLDETGTEGKIHGISIEDNGVGFNTNNFDSFCTSESTYKLEKGCKGVGRFFWLKSFDNVDIVSCFEENGKKWQRKVKFSKTGIKSVVCEHDFEARNTIVFLNGYKEEYRKQPSSYKTTSKIAQRVLEHCLSYFITNSSPDITISDEGGAIHLSALFDQIRSTIRRDVLTINGVEFTLNHVKLFSTHAKMHNMVLCANHRDVKSIGLSQTIGSAAQIVDGDDRFVYAAYLESHYLDKHVDSSRMDFGIPDKPGLLQEEYPVSILEILKSSESRIKDYLQIYINSIKEQKKKLIEDYVENVNPGLRAVAMYCPELYNDLEPNSSNEKIDEVLYKYKGKTEYSIKRISSELLKSQPKTFSEVEEKVAEVSEKITAFQKDQLAGYILLRKIVIDILDKKLELSDSGKHAKEVILHDALFPTKQNSDKIMYENHNLWLLDERLSFHAFANSDIPLSEIGIEGCDERPDILTFSEIGPDRIARSISIIELKRPQRKEYDEDPVKQMLRYVRKIRENRQVSHNGRTILTDSTTKFYCYAICDLTHAIHEYAENQQIAKLKGELGYYMYNANFNSHIEIIAYDKLIADAIQRNKMFFNMLGI